MAYTIHKNVEIWLYVFKRSRTFGDIYLFVANATPPQKNPSMISSMKTLKSNTKNISLAFNKE